MQGLHQVHSMAARLVGKVEALQQAPGDRQQPRLLHVVMQQPAQRTAQRQQHIHGKNFSNSSNDWLLLLSMLDEPIDCYVCLIALSSIY